VRAGFPRAPARGAARQAKALTRRVRRLERLLVELEGGRPAWRGAVWLTTGLMFATSALLMTQALTRPSVSYDSEAAHVGHKAQSAHVIEPIVIDPQITGTDDRTSAGFSRPRSQ